MLACHLVVVVFFLFSSSSVQARDETAIETLPSRMDREMNTTGTDSRLDGDLAPIK